VVIVDAREARLEKTTPGQFVAGVGLKLAVLRDGMTYLLR
jgi:hypothetical protein